MTYKTGQGTTCPLTEIPIPPASLLADLNTSSFDLIRSRFSGRSIGEIDLVCQAKFNLMMLWGQLTGWHWGLGPGRARMPRRWPEGLTLPEGRKIEEIWVKLSLEPISFFKNQPV